MAQNDSRKTLQILFEEEKYEYIYIPRIQRDYAQGRIDGEATVIRDNILDDVASRKPLSWGIRKEIWKMAARRNALFQSMANNVSLRSIFLHYMVKKSIVYHSDT